MAVDDRPLQENRTIIVLPMDGDETRWIKDEEGNLLPIKSMEQWFDAVQPEVIVSGLRTLNGAEEAEESFRFSSLKDFSPEALRSQSQTLKDITFVKSENEAISKKLNKSRKLRQLLGE
jgi:predicted component of type VI protein secretion system